MTTDEHSLDQATQAQLTEAAKLVGGRPWGADRGKPRIYLRSARDRKVFFEFPDYPTGDVDDVLGGAKLSVSIDDCGQHPNWYKGQRAKIIAGHACTAIALAVRSDIDLAEAILDCDGEFDEDELDSLWSHAANGRLAEMREIVAQYA
jgi:hypothetical protein